jgi:uncharacterized repeat protein (TIGR02543 family)
MNYVKLTGFELTGAGSYNLSRSQQPDSIRVRGNSTAAADKKPYRIKFDKKTSLFGKEAAKSWVLLANFYDGTFTLNAIAFRLGKKMGLEFTHSSQLVELYINNQNKGIYELTEQNQVNPGRVDIDDTKGWLVEFDYHDGESDQIKFNSAVYSLPTRIRSPEVESNFSVNNPKVTFVRDEVNALCNKMNENGFPTNGYRDMLDLDSWAKYVLIQQFIDNFDFNSKTQTNAVPGSNYAYKDACGRIKAGPLWDFDLSAGVTNNMGGGMFPGMGGGGGGFPAHYQTYQEAVEPKHKFYKRLWEDPVFKAKFKKLWDAHQNDLKAIPAFIDSISGTLSGVNWGSNKWANNSMMGSANLTQQQHNTEVSNLKTWWNNRLNWFGGQISGFNTSQDVTQAPLTCQPSSSSNRPSSSSANNSAPSSSSRSNATFTVTFNANSQSASPAPQAQTVREGEKAARPAAMTRQPEGTWTFMGWFKDANFTSGWDFDSDVVSGNITLYAKWADAQEIAPIIKNGLAINAASSVSIAVFSLNGNLVRKQIFSKGHAIKLDGLPKGMYIVKATFGNGASPVVFRLPVN